MTSVSACIVARNEEPVIDRALRSVAGVVDEIVLVHDGPCEDRTLDIGREHGARVFEQPLIGNPEAQTVFAYEQARCEWLLNIDADEFLSDELRAAVPELVAREDVAGYEFLWKMWDGERYVTEDGPYKLALHRREATQLVGMLQAQERIDGRVERTRLHLEHRPRYDNFALRTMLTKWRRWAKVHARELTGPWEELPRFNWRGPEGWPWYRRVLNVLAPVLFVPYVLASFANFVRIGRGALPLAQNLRFSLYQTIYAALVQLEVIRCVYGRRR